MCVSKPKGPSPEQQELMRKQAEQITLQNELMKKQSAETEALKEHQLEVQKVNREGAVSEERRKRTGKPASTAAFFSGSQAANIQGVVGSLLRRSVG